MRYRFLGRTGLKISDLCLGTMNFGDVTDEKESCMIMDKAIDAGINFFDTADVYGGLQWPEIPRGYGISEEIIGRWLKKSGQRGQGCIGYQKYQPMDFGPKAGICQLIIFEKRVKTVCDA